MITVVGSLKGGSGKSTVTFNLGVWLALANASVAVVDADPQATLTDVLQVREEEGYRPMLSHLPIDALKNPEIVDGFEQILVDIGTASMDNLRQAIAVADRILVPVPPSQADIWSTQRFLKFVEANTRGRELLVQGFINRADTHHAIRESDEAAAALVTLPGLQFLRPRLAQRTVYRRSFSEGLAVFEQQARGKGAAEWNALAAVLFPELLS